MSGSWTTIFWLGDIDAADHEVSGPTRLLEQYVDKPRMIDFLGAFLAEIQRCEDLTVQMLVERSVYTAEGVQLDVLGDIVVQPRAGLTDEAYRAFILCKVLANRSQGKWPDFFEALNLLEVDGIQAREWYPCNMRITVAGLTYPEPTNRLIMQMIPGGVRGEFAYSERDDINVFKTSSVLGTDQSSSTEGTANIAGTTGGNVVGMVWS